MMTVSIEVPAFRAILFGALSCRCPVTLETEQALFAEYFRLQKEDVIDFAPIRAIAESNPERTPVHNLLEVASYGRDDPDRFTITMGDVIRALGSMYHYKNVTANIDPLVVQVVPSFLVSHMALPARLNRRGGSHRAVYEFEGGQIVFDHVFIPPDLPLEESHPYALHMGAVIAELTSELARGLRGHLGLIPGFDFLCRQTGPVDFRDFQYYGDYHDQVAARFRRHFSF